MDSPLVRKQATVLRLLAISKPKGKEIIGGTYLCSYILMVGTLKVLSKKRKRV
jgi:hypothetical protein